MPRSQQFLEACMAAAALIARVDGWVSAEEREIVAHLHRGLDELSDFDMGSLLAQFDHFVGAIKVPNGIDTVWDAIDRIAGNDTEARVVLAFSRAIAGADKVLSNEETMILQMIASHLGLADTDRMKFQSSPAGG